MQCAAGPRPQAAGRLGGGEPGRSHDDADSAAREARDSAQVRDAVPLKSLGRGAGVLAAADRAVPAHRLRRRGLPPQVRAVSLNIGTTEQEGDGASPEKRHILPRHTAPFHHCCLPCTLGKWSLLFTARGEPSTSNIQLVAQLARHQSVTTLTQKYIGLPGFGGLAAGSNGCRGS